MRCSEHEYSRVAQIGFDLAVDPSICKVNDMLVQSDAMEGGIKELGGGGGSHEEKRSV